MTYFDNRDNFTFRTSPTSVDPEKRTVLRRWQIENHKDSETNLRLFKRELEALQTLKHPNIVQMLGAEDNQNGFAVIHLEYISNLSLNEVIFYATYRYSALTMIYWLQDILNGVGFLHFNGFLHRDLKPSNILVTADGSLKLIDFETAKTNLDPSKTYTFGKDEYRPPESFSFDGSAAQAMESSLDRRTWANILPRETTETYFEMPQGVLGDS